MNIRLGQKYFYAPMGNDKVPLFFFLKVEQFFATHVGHC